MGAAQQDEWSHANVPVGSSWDQVNQPLSHGWRGKPPNTPAPSTAAGIWQQLTRAAVAAAKERSNESQQQQQRSTWLNRTAELSSSSGTPYHLTELDDGSFAGVDMAFEIDYPLAFNGSDCYWNNSFNECNVTNATMLNQEDFGGANFWILILLIFPVFTVFGNVLVVMSVVRERSLQSVTNYFIVSLAIADIMVAVFVMPLAVYVEVYTGYWGLGDKLCDAWVAFDVLGCTASILNLTAISVDRFIAVTQPIKYAKHKNSKRVYVMLGLVWLVSVAISSPIALGMNYTDARLLTPYLCVFYNPEFLIYSSMGSFYIPCIVMILLYWRIFRAIHARAKKAAMQRKAKTGSKFSGIIKNQNAQTAKAVAGADSSADNCTKQLLPRSHSGDRSALRLARGSPPQGRTETTFTNEALAVNAAVMEVTDSDTTGGNSGNLEDMELQRRQLPNNQLTPSTNHNTSSGVDNITEWGEESQICSAIVEVQQESSRSSTRSSLLNPPKRGVLAQLKSPIRLPGLRRKEKSSTVLSNTQNGDSSPPRRSVTKFNFHLRHSKKRKDKSSTRRERKATKTLAIVLGCFLVCWVPFFTINIMNAICIQYKLQYRPECNLDGSMLFSIFVWLGYMNSFLNPVIYTIFNVEFRKAFKKILTEPCNRRH